MPAEDPLAGYAYEVTGSARNGFAIAPNDASELSHVTRGLYVGTTGNVTVVFADQSANVTIPNVPAGTTLAVQVKAVMANGTSASNMVGFH